jgi:hypothetical protein
MVADVQKCHYLKGSYGELSVFLAILRRNSIPFHIEHQSLVFGGVAVCSLWSGD